MINTHKKQLTEAETMHWSITSCINPPSDEFLFTYRDHDTKSFMVSEGTKELITKDGVHT